MRFLRYSLATLCFGVSIGCLGPWRFSYATRVSYTLNFEGDATIQKARTWAVAVDAQEVIIACVHRSTLFYSCHRLSSFDLLAATC